MNYQNPGSLSEGLAGAPAVLAERSTTFNTPGRGAEPALDRVEAETWAKFAPPPRGTRSDWIDRHRVLSPESSASPGPWRTAAAPYLREMQDAMGDPRTETIVFWKSAQIGGTECLINTLLYELVNDPGPILVLQPTLEMATAFSKDRLAPAIRDSAVVRALIGAREPAIPIMRFSGKESRARW